MIRKIHRKWFEVWGDEEAQNQILKYLLLVFAVMVVIELSFILMLACRKPLIVSLSGQQTSRVQYIEPDANAILREIIRVIENYLRTRHNWDWTTIEARSKASVPYVAPEFREKFLLTVQEQIRLAKDKQIAQRLFPDEPTVDLKGKKATVHAERILIVNGIRAAQGLNLEIGFNRGERTTENPEGVYIVSEKLDPVN